MSMRYEVKQTGESHWQIWDNEAEDWIFGITKRPRKVNRPGKAARIVSRLTAGDGYGISAKAFGQWVEDVGKSGAECAELLGVSLESINNYKQRGGNRIVALACAAIIAKLEPYGETK